MKKIKSQKGITLIALILTIVVLIVLGSVAISSIQNEGILSYAENAANKYNQAQREEQGVLGGYVEILQQHSAKVKKISFVILETTYYAEEGMTWEEWLESEYNVDKCFVRDNGKYVCEPTGGVITKIAADLTGSVELTENIVEGKKYYGALYPIH